jgi:PAS domain S-box-containing protein
VDRFNTILEIPLLSARFQMPRRLVQALLLALVIAAPGATSVAAQGAGERNKVLLLFTHSSDLPAQRILEQALRSTLRHGSPVPVELYSEYLDAVRTNVDDYEQDLVRQLHGKYRAKKFDLIFVINPPALKMVLRNREALFPDTPVVFIVLEQRSLSDLNLGPNVTGVWGESDYGSNLELALALHPGTRQVVLISGVSEWDNYWRARVQEEFRPYEAKLEFTYLIGLSITELQRALAGLPPQTIVFFVSSVQDNAGNNYSNLEVLSSISTASNAPIYGASDAHLGLGIVGGRLLSLEALGVEGAQVGLRVLAGEKPEAIAPHGIPSVSMFDWRELKRWGISEKSLPPGSIVRFRMPSFWDQYKWYAIAGISVILLQTALIGGLVINRSLRKRAEEHLRESEARRLLAQQAARIGTFEWNIQTGVNIWSQELEAMYGLPRGSFARTLNAWESLVYPEDRDKALASVQRALKTGAPVEEEWRITWPDGSTHWIFARFQVFLDSAGERLKVTGINIDITERKLSDESLRRSEERNRAILRAIPDLMFIQTLDGTFLDYQAKDPNDLLVPPSEFLGKNVREVMPADLAETFLISFRRAKETDEPQSVEYMLPLEGGKRWYEARIVITEGDKVLSVVRDITDRKRAEEAVKENEAKLGGIVGSAMDAIISIDESQRIVLFNDAAQKIFGCAESEAMGQPFDCFLPERFRDAHRQHIRAFGESGAKKKSLGPLGPMFGRRTNGNEFPMEASISQLDLHGQKFYTVILRDITKRQQAVEALRESEQRFRNMADTAPAMIWVSGVDKLRTYFNHQWLNFTGRTMEEEIGDGWAQGVHPDDYQHYIETYTAAFDARQPFRMEYRLRRADGQFRWIYASATARFSPAEKFLGYIGCCIDITERKEAEEALANLSGQLIQARENERARIARELHDDINQSMALVSVELEQIIQGFPAASEILERQLITVRRQISETSKEIHRISHDLHPSKLVHLGLVAALKGLCDELQQRHPMQIDFTYQVPYDLPPDISLCLYRTVQECLNNVIKHSGAESAHVQLVGTDGEIALTVSDSGIGFDVESRRSKNGLGLVSMRERLRLVGGRITIDSRPSHGTRIVAMVPIAQRGLKDTGHSPADKTRAVGE